MTKVSDLLACYQELARGESVEHLLEKYVRADVLIANELFDKGVTLTELTDFITKRDQHIESMLSAPLKKAVIFSKRLRRK